MKIMDTHCHVLPGVDDGAQDEDMALDMVDIAYSQGVRAMILTPHYYLGSTKETGQDFKTIFEAFQKKVSEKYSDFSLYLGNEIYWSKGVIEAVKDGRINTMNDTKYVLVEFAPSTSYTDIYEAVRQLKNARLRPVLAHVERYHSLVKHIERIEELCDNGAYLQMNADSLVGGMFDGQVKWCRKLVELGYISMLGTDAHNTDDRAPYVQDALSWLKKKIDPEQLEALLYENGETMLSGGWLS